MSAVNGIYPSGLMQGPTLFDSESLFIEFELKKKKKKLTKRKKKATPKLTSSSSLSSLPPSPSRTSYFSPSSSKPYTRKKLPFSPSKTALPDIPQTPTSPTTPTPPTRLVIHHVPSPPPLLDSTSIHQTDIRDQADKILSKQGQIQSPKKAYSPPTTKRTAQNANTHHQIALNSFVESTSNPCTSSELAWVSTYANDRNTFRSETKWAQIKLKEVTQLTRNGALPISMIACLSSQLIVDQIPKLTKLSSKAGNVIDTILNSIFILTHNNQPTSPSAAIILDRNKWPQNEAFTLQGASGFRTRVNLFLSCPTYYDHVKWLWQKLKYELSLRPKLEIRIKARVTERQFEARAMEAICTRWARKKNCAVFFIWFRDTEIEKRRHLLGKYMFYILELKTKDVFRAWRDMYRNSKRERERGLFYNVREQAERMKLELELVRKRNKELVVQLSVVRQARLIRERQLEDALIIVQAKARQPPTLSNLLNGLTTPLITLQTFLQQCLTYQIDETHRTDVDTNRLAPLYTWKTAKANHELDTVRTTEGKLDPESDFDKGKENEIKSWVPGLLPSKEYTHCFKPFATRPMIRLRRWANNLITRDWMKASGARPKRNLWLNTATDMRDSKNWISIFRSIGAVNAEVVQVEYPNAMELTDRSDDYFKLNPEIPAAMQLCDYIHTKLKPPSGRWMNQECITHKGSPLSAEDVEKNEIRVRKLKARETETGIIVHTMSKYLGMRVHVESTNEHKSAAFLAELFCHHFKPQAVWPKLEQRSIEEYNANFVAPWSTVKAKIEEDVIPNFIATGEVKLMDTIVIPMWESSDGDVDLKKIGNDIKLLDVNARETIQKVATDYQVCLDDRVKFRTHIHDVVGHTWQSLCTTLLSRRYQTESDVDDGTFTTISRLQLATEFKRIGIKGEDEQEDQCVRMKAVLKNRIRDLKRIFQYYAAAGDVDGGSATSMNHGEFWKFVKQCKLQKDRKLLPSVRVDLIFQACNVDFSKSGKERIESDDGEMDGNEFVEGLARLAVYVYKSGSVADRLEKMIDFDVLPLAFSIDTDVFRERIASDRVTSIFDKHKPNTKIIFREYAADDDTGDAVLANDTMNSNELVTFCRDFKLIGPLLSERAAKTIFAYVQQEEEKNDEKDTESGDSEMVYAEFQESLAAIACQMVCDPYLVVEMRIDNFMCREVVKPALAMQRFRGKNLKKT